MNCSKLAVTSVTVCTLFFGPPAAELAIEGKEGHNVAMLQRDFNDHPIEEGRPFHFATVNVAMSASSSIASSAPQDKWAVAS